MKNLFLLLLSFLVFSCNSIKSIKSAIDKSTPYEQYVNSLDKATLLKTPMAEAWLQAGERVLNDSVIVNLPFTESGYFAAAEPEARAYQFEVKEGQVLTVEGESIADKDGALFLDLFVWKDNKWDQLAHADSSLELSQEFSRDYTCLVRLQPELLMNAYYSISISLTPVLINPVSGASNRSIGSFYGADRDGGRRSHEGVDIFAPKGTPVVAPTDGYVNRVGTNTLGGKVVWMRDSRRGHSYYFAHLDEQLVQSGTAVKQGDTLGLVGNTGNARTTPPHLHFGIYQRGSKDPIHYLRTFDVMLRSPMDTTFQPEAYRVTAQKINLRSGPGTGHLSIGQLDQHTYVKIIAQQGEWYRVALPDYKQGFVHKNLIGAVDEGKPVTLAGPVVLLSETRADAVPVAYLSDSSQVELLASFEGYEYVKTTDGQTGWLQL